MGVAAYKIGHREITFINNSATGDDNNDISSTNVTSIDISNGNISADNANCGVYTSNNNGTESVGIRQLMVVSVTLTRGRFSAWFILKSQKLDIQ